MTETLPISTSKENLAGPTHVVGLGASAGGLEALQSFFGNMAPDSGLAFVVVQHLSPDYKSLMVELLSKHTTMRVCRVEDGMAVEANTVYLIPPKYNMTIFDGRLLLNEQDPRGGINLPIDLFLKSLATDKRDRAVGIILSGTGSDGTRGIRAIKEEGGMVMVQNEDSAKFSGMPGSAIATGLADYILPATELPAELLKFVRHPFTARPQQSPAVIAGQNTIDKLCSIVRQQTGLDLSCYKPSTLYRRIERRMSIAQVNDLDEYLHYLQHSTREVSALAKEVLICVTKFFRDSESFRTIRELALPRLFAEATPDRPVRCWVVGCSTGEEAYSLAMLMDDYITEFSLNLDFKIFATDVERSAIEFAGAGTYPKSIAADINQPFLDRYFTRNGEDFQISRKIRDRVVFAPQNVIKDPPFTRVDLVTCRNVLIYLNPAVQKKVMSYFHFALRPGGTLFLGSSETIGDMQDCFDTTDGKHRIYRKRPDSISRLSLPSTPPLPEVSIKSLQSVERSTARQTQNDLFNQIREKLLADYVPCCLAISSKLDLIHTFGELPRFITLPAGKATLNILKMVPRDLSLALSTSAQKCIRESQPVRYQSVRFTHQENSYELDLKIEPYTLPGNEEDILLVFLETRLKQPTLADGGDVYDPEDKTIQRIVDLENELQTTRENLQAAIEELEASNEELQATNEELLASNEELQSTNEELESVNEELYTVNSEYQGKIQELTETNNDLDNFLRSTDVATIFLDRNLQIRRFTPALTREIPLMPHDNGRSITEIAHPILRKIEQHAQEVIRQRREIETSLEKDNGTSYLLRILPYERDEGRIDGVITVLIDITRIRRAESEAIRFSQEKKEAIQLRQLVLDAMNAHVAVIDEAGSILFTNKKWESFARENGLPDGKGSVGTNYFEACSSAHGEDAVQASHTAHEIRRLLTGQTQQYSTEYPCHSPNEKRWFRMEVAPLQFNEKQRGAVIMHLNITSRVESELALAESNKKLQQLLKKSK